MDCFVAVLLAMTKACKFALAAPNFVDQT